MSFGANFHDDPITRSTLRKTHTLGLNSRCEYDPHTSYDFAAVAHSAFIRSSSAYGGTFAGTSNSFSNTVPKDGTLSSVQTPPNEAILRFLGYTRDVIPESPDEVVRIRKVAVVYHVQDGTVMIREAQQINSGMVQSVMLKRQRVLRAGGTANDDFLSEKDFYIGAKVDIVGRVVTIVDMDERTRNYFKDVLGVAVPDVALPWPEEDTYNAKVARKLAVNPKKAIPTTDMEHRRALESCMGGAVSKHAPDDIRIAQQFFQNKINQSLQFAAYWDDRKSISGDLRLVVIRYYLENDSIEVVEKRPENCGREGGARLINRQRIQNPVAETDPSIQENTYGHLLKRGYYTMDDFQLGKAINFYGRDYIVYDADAFTREWFLKNRSRDLGPTVDISEVKSRGEKVAPVQYPPPHDGFGSEEDSLHAWKHLLRKPMPIDSAKLAREEGKVMLFSACFHNSKAPEDQGREFLVYFYRQTDEVEIIERQLRNAGIIGGKFLAKGKHRKLLPDGRKVLYEPSDFQVGKPVVIAGREFMLLELDERSRKQIAGEPEPVTAERVRELVVLLKNLLQWKFCRIHEAYRRIAPEGALTAKELRAFFVSSSANITEAEAANLVNYCSPDGTGVISYDAFVNLMGIPNSNNLDEMSNSPRAVRNVQVDQSVEAQQAIMGATIGAQQRSRAQVLKRMFVAKVVERRGTIQEVFRLLAGHSPTSRMAKPEFRQALIDVFHMTLPKEDIELLVREIFGRDEEITFKQFHLYVESGL